MIIPVGVSRYLPPSGVFGKISKLQKWKLPEIEKKLYEPIRVPLQHSVL
jgi:hypothetical protein